MGYKPTGSIQFAESVVEPLRESLQRPCSHEWAAAMDGIAGRECIHCGQRELLYTAPYDVPEGRRELR